MSGAAYYVKFGELVEVLGAHAAKRLTMAFGGRRFYVRETLPDDHFLIPVLGDTLARRFADHVATGIGGIYVEIPIAGSGEFHGYRLRMRELASNLNLTEEQVAGEMGVHMRTVRRMRAKLRAERNAHSPAPR